MEFKHIPVMLNECLDALNLKDGGVYVDATIGGAGHSFEILSRTNDSLLIGIDQDSEALKASKVRLNKFKNRVILEKNNFQNLKEVLVKNKIDKIDGILIDLGVSSYQIDTPERGFSFRFDGPLDMRMDQENPLTAYDVVNKYDESKLKQIIYDYGEEKFASNISRQIVRARGNAPIETTNELKQIIISGASKGKNNAMDSVQRVFQAIRIEVNGELDCIAKTIECATEFLAPGGRIAIMSFHSLEDRIVKQTFKKLSLNCTCPPEFPVCVCGGKNAKLKLITSKPIVATNEEKQGNSRSACAKLRVAEKLKQNEQY